jgi:hypothetical protein
MTMTLHTSISKTCLSQQHAIKQRFIREPDPNALPLQWDSLSTHGHTLESGNNANKDLSNFTLAKQFGDRISVHCCQHAEPSDAAMALLWRFSAASGLTMVSNNQPAHTLKYIPSVLEFKHAKVAVPADSAFLFSPRHSDLIRTARRSPPGATAVLVSQEDDAVLRQVADLMARRPDMQVYGCTPRLPHGPQAGNPSGAGLDAFSRVSALRTGGSAFVARPLSHRDALWLCKQTHFPCSARMVMFAPFGQHGIDRPLFRQWMQNHPDAVKHQITRAIKPDAETSTSLLPEDLMLSSTATGATERLKNLRRSLRTLGTTAVFGSSGHIGSAITEALSGKLPLFALCRKPEDKPVHAMSSPRYVMRQTKHLPPEANVKTAFLSASVPWKQDPQTGKIIFDRAALLEDNLKQVVIPMLRELPKSVRLLQVITNPSSDLAYAAWLLRPDLAEHSAITAHVGTDVTRQRAHVLYPEQTDTWFTLGPHSPQQLNVDLAAGRIDEQIAVMGKTLSQQAGDRSVIDPTAMASIVEATELLNHKASSFGLPLGKEEAELLSGFMAQMGQPIAVSEGIAITLPRDSARQIRWDMLKEASKIPGFATGARQAIDEMESAKRSILNLIGEQIKHNRPDLAHQVNEPWLLKHRSDLLNLLHTG